MSIQVERSDDPAEVLDGAHDHLVGRPVEHNLVLSLLHQRVASPEPGRYWIVRDGDVVAGVGFQSPVDYVVTATPMSPESAESMAEALVDAGGTVPGVQAEAGTAARIAGAWTELTRTAAVPRMGMRIYAMDELVRPDGDGELRTATGRRDGARPGLDRRLPPRHR